MKTVDIKFHRYRCLKEVYYSSIQVEDLSGTYVLLTEAEAEIQQVKVDWVERCKKFRKQDADEHEAEIAALRERQRVLVDEIKNYLNVVGDFVTGECDKQKALEAGRRLDAALAAKEG